MASGKYELWCGDACVVWATLTQLRNEPIAVVFEFLVEIPCLFFMYVCRVGRSLFTCIFTFV